MGSLPGMLSESGMFLEAIRRALTERVEAVLAEEVEAAVSRARARIQEQVGTIATGLLQHYRVSMMGRDGLQIVVKIEHPAAQRESRQ